MQPFTPGDMALFQDLGQLSASATHAACGVRRVDQQADDYTSSIWTFALDGSAARAFTAGPADNGPEWSPDGSRLAFVAARGGGAPQVHLIDAAGGEARVLSRIPHGVGSAQWSPDGRSLLAACAVPIDVESREARRPAEAAPPPDAPQLAWRLPYKNDGSGYRLASGFQLFVVDARSGEARQVTHGPYDVMAQAWSPDSRRIVHTRSRPGRESHRTDAWVMDADGGNPRQLTTDLATTLSPRWSPDGRWIVLAGARREGDAQTRLFLVDAASGAVSQLGSDDLEVASPDAVFWRADSRAVLLIAARRACQHIVSLSVPAGAMTPLVEGERHVSELALAGERLAFFSESANTPRELCTCNLDGGAVRQLSFLNAWWDQRTPLAACIRSFEVPDGRGGRETIEAWLVHADEPATAPRPLLMEAHGGPNSFALLGYPWNTYWNVLCSLGWAIVVPHCVGSTSFGREFAERLNGHWGELDFPQFMAVLDALQAEGTASEVAVIAGKSYGGYMSAWAVGHTDRFKAAIVAAPVANLESHFGTSDGGYYGQPFVIAAERHIDPGRYRELSPVNSIHDAVTPTLLLQGTDDERCPRGQSEELFAVLMRVGQAPAEMVLYPGGDHHLYETGKPSHRVDVVHRMMDWIARWT